MPRQCFYERLISLCLSGLYHSAPSLFQATETSTERIRSSFVFIPQYKIRISSYKGSIFVNLFLILSCLSISVTASASSVSSAANILQRIDPAPLSSTAQELLKFLLKVGESSLKTNLFDSNHPYTQEQHTNDQDNLKRQQLYYLAHIGIESISAGAQKNKKDKQNGQFSSAIAQKNYTDNYLDRVKQKEAYREMMNLVQASLEFLYRRNGNKKNS